MNRLSSSQKLSVQCEERELDAPKCEPQQHGSSKHDSDDALCILDYGRIVKAEYPINSRDERDVERYECDVEHPGRREPGIFGNEATAHVPRQSHSEGSEAGGDHQQSDIDRLDGMFCDSDHRCRRFLANLWVANRFDIATESAALILVLYGSEGGGRSGSCPCGRADPAVGAVLEDAMARIQPGTREEVGGARGREFAWMSEGVLEGENEGEVAYRRVAEVAWGEGVVSSLRCESTNGES